MAGPVGALGDQDGKFGKNDGVMPLEERVTKERVDSTIVEGIREVELHHGLRLGTSATLIGTFDDICYCNETQEYLVLDTGSMVHRYSMQGKPIRPSYPLGSTMLFTRMLWCPLAKALACHIPHDDMVWIVDTSCKLIQIVRNEFKIEDLFYSSITNQMIIAGTNKIMTFPMDDLEHPINSLYTTTYLDSSYGPLWAIEYSSLIDNSSELSVVGSYLTNIYIMSTRPEGEAALLSQFSNTRMSATSAPITAVCYHHTSDWIITGDQQGNVAGWSLKLECVMSCPNGHEDQVRLIVRHPSICGFLTISNGKVLQVWSCNLRGKIESFRDIGQIWRIAINEPATSLATLGTKFNSFHMNQIYVFYAPLTAPATNLYSTANPTHPTRVIVTSSDNTVRILSSRTGHQINVQLLSPKLEVIAAAYSAITNRMYTMILRSGEILVSNVKTKPMTLKYVWVNDERTITSIVAYESFDKIVPIDATEKIKIFPVSTLIIAGTLDGMLVHIEETSGKHANFLSAHDGPVIDLSCSTTSRRLVSVGSDKSVKVWRIYPDVTPPLVLVCSLYWTFPITRVALLRFTVCMVGSTERSNDHRLIMYDTSQRTRLDHHKSKDHSAFIVSVCTLESLDICASSSLDKTLRIWNPQNELLKILQINTVAKCIIFSSLRGDIVFSAGKHLYRIPYENHLSPEHRARIIAEDIPQELDDVIIPEKVDYRIYEEEVDREKALHPVSSAPFGSLDTEHSEAPNLQQMLLKQLALNLRYREEDILRIKDGIIKGVRLVGNKSIMSKEAWDKHLMELLDTSIKTVLTHSEPEQDFFKNAANYLPRKKVVNQPEIFRMIHGHSVSSLEGFEEDSQDIVKMIKLPRSGLFPNSLIYKIQEETPEEEAEIIVEKEKIKYQYPPEFLYGKEHEDSQEKLEVPTTLSELANLDFEQEEIFEE